MSLKLLLDNMFHRCDKHQTTRIETDELAGSTRTTRPKCPFGRTNSVQRPSTLRRIA
jgi:hypothetical protein